MLVKTTLPKGDFFIHIIVMLNLVLLVAVVTFACSNIVPTFGFSVKPPPSEFMMENMSIDKKIIVSVTAGEDPVVFFDEKRLEQGMTDLPGELDKIVNDYMESEADIGRVAIILVLDQAVSRATEQKLFDMVLSRNMLCAVASDPQ